MHAGTHAHCDRQMNGNSKTGSDVEFVVQMQVCQNRYVELDLRMDISFMFAGVSKIGRDFEFDLQMHILFCFFCLQVCGQKWADISEYGAGLSVLTDSKYGYSSVGGVLRISL